MADQSDGGGFLGGLLGLFKPTDYSAMYTGSLLKDPATGQMDPAVQQAFRSRALGAAAEAFAQGGMPVPYKGGVPFGATLGHAGAAATTAGDSLIDARMKAAQTTLALANAGNAEALSLVRRAYLEGQGKRPTGDQGGGGAGTGTGGASVPGGPKTGPAAILANQGAVPAADVYNYALSQGASRNRAIMLASATNAESGGDPNTGHDGGIGYGLFGHNSTRLTGENGMYAFAGLGANAPVGTQVPWQKQVDWALHELDNKESAAGKMADAATNPAELTEAQLAFERPNRKINNGNYDQRFASTSALWSQPAGAPPQTAAVPDPANPYAGTSGQGTYVPPGGTQPRDIPTGLPVGQTPPAAAPPTVPPAAPPALPGGALPPGSEGNPGPVSGLLGPRQGPQVAAAAPPPAPGGLLSPAGAAIAKGIATAQAGGLPGSGMVAGDNAVPPAPPPAPNPAAARADQMGQEGGGVPGLFTPPPAGPQAPPAIGPPGPVAPPAVPGPVPPQAPPGPPRAVTGAPPPPPLPPEPPPLPAAQSHVSNAEIEWAKKQAGLASVGGLTLPPDVAALATLPTDLAKQEQQIRLKAYYDRQLEVYKAQLDNWNKQNAPFDQRENSVRQDPQHPGQIYGNYTALGADGRVHRYVMVPNPNGPQGPPIDLTPNGTALSPQEQARGAATGTNQANLGGLPGTPFGAPPGAPAPATPGPPGAVPSPAPAPAPAAPAPLTGPTIIGGERLMPAPVTPTTPQGTLITPRGTKLPDATSQFMPQSAEELKKLITDGPELTRAWTESIEPARTAELRLETMYRAYQMMESGAYTTQKLEFQKLLNAIGIDPKIISSNKISDIQLAMHENILSSLPALRESMPRPTQFEFKTISANRANPDLAPAANMQMLGEDIAQARQTQYLARDWNTAQQLGWRNPDSFKTVWGDMNKPADEVARVKQELGPVKGAVETVPAGKVVYGPDGQPYVNDNGVLRNKNTMEPYKPAAR